jgi:oxalate decarboxylase
MISATRRLFMGSASFGLIAPGFRSASAAIPADGHAAGLDVAPAPQPLALIPRKPGEAPPFTASLDRAPLKQTSGGWAREITSRTLPIATSLAGAHLFVNPGGCREMHWHNSDEWALVLGGHGQVTAMDQTGDMEVVNVAPGDLWYFPRGHAHSIHTLGDQHLHAVLVFNDGLYAEHGTFGLSDWMSRMEPAELAQALGVAPGALAGLPIGETYIMQGAVLALDGPQAQAERPWPAERSHRYRLMDSKPGLATPGGMIYSATQARFPMTAMAGLVTHLQPGAMQQLHWHTEANEWHYVIQGKVRFTLFGADKHLAVAELGPGDCAYIPANCGHTVQNQGENPSEVVSVLDSPRYDEVGLSDWLQQAPAHLLANNLGLDPAALPHFARTPSILPGYTKSFKL